MLSCHLLNAELAASAFMMESNIQFDVASDLDMHRIPVREISCCCFVALLVVWQDLLEPYRVVMIAGHSEYWSADMYIHLQRFVHNGGNVLMLSGKPVFSSSLVVKHISLSGNSMYWRSELMLDGLCP